MHTLVLPGMYTEHSSQSAYHFLQNPFRIALFPIRAVQTENGTEFTNALLVTKVKHRKMFEAALEEMGTVYPADSHCHTPSQWQGGTTAPDRYDALLQPHAHVLPGERTQATGPVPAQKQYLHHNLPRPPLTQ